MLREISRSQKDKYFITLLKNTFQVVRDAYKLTKCIFLTSLYLFEAEFMMNIRYPEQSSSWTQKGEGWLPGARVGGMGSCCLMATELQFLQDEES